MERNTKQIIIKKWSREERKENRTEQRIRYNREQKNKTREQVRRGIQSTQAESRRENRGLEARECSERKTKQKQRNADGIDDQRKHQGLEG